MAIDVTSPHSRRSLITAAISGVAAAAAATLTGAQRVLAAGDDGQAMEVGGQYLDAQSVTWLRNKTNDLAVLEAQSAGAGNGMVGTSNTGDGVFGQSNGTFGYGLHGKSLKQTGFAAGIVGEITNPDGAASLSNNYATHGHAQGAQGTSDSPVGWASTGWARKGGTAIVGASGADFPTSRIPAKTGVFGYAEKGRGGVFDGPTAQVRLVPSTAATHPASGLLGDLFLDKNKRLWFCKGGTSWHQLA